MKITILLVFVVLCQVQAEVYSQIASISLNLKNSTVEEVLSAIEEKSDFYFLYNPKLIDADRKVDMEVKDTQIQTILNKLFDDTDVVYSVDNRQIVLSRKESVQNSAQISQQATRKLTGKITDEKGEGIIGVNVSVKGTGFGTITDEAGNFSFNIPKAGGTLTVAYIGYVTQEIKITNQASINVSLKEDTKLLEEVVVVGYGTQKKSDLTGSVSSVKMAEISRTPITTIDQGLIGRTSGVQVLQTSGMPGAVASIRVRGSSSLQGGNEPLYVIDGFPVYAGTGVSPNSSFSDAMGKAQLSGLATINPSDIESVEILKDAAATAIYGARAANGVVLITTKTGQKGRDVVSFNASYGIQNVAKKINVMGAQDYAALVNEAYVWGDGASSAHGKPFYDEAKMAEIAKIGNGTNWQNEIFRQGVTQDYQLSISGGDAKTVYAISGGYSGQQGIIMSSDFKRYSARLNLDRHINDFLTFGTHMSVSHAISNLVATDTGGEGGVVTGAMKMNPILPVYIDQEAGIFTPVNTPGTLEPNPVATLKKQKYISANSRLLGDMYGQWEIIKDLKLKVSIGTDVIYNKYNLYTPSDIYQSNGIAKAIVSMDRSINWLNENTLNWSKSFGKHSLNVLAGLTMQRNNFESVLGRSQGFVNNALLYNNLGAGSTYNQPLSAATQWSILSYLARVNYSYLSRYLLSVNARVDGSSRFGANNKYGFFPSVSAGWRISEEAFMNSLKSTVSNLKIRAGYGFTGNTEIGLYQSLATLGSTSWTFGGGQQVTGFFPNIIPNPDLKWERTGQFDLGLDLGLFADRLRLTADYYRKLTTDLLYNVAIPSASGFSTMLQNIGSVENKGAELLIEGDILKGQFTWTAGFNIATNKNKVISLGGALYKEMPEGDGHLKTGSFRRLVVGQPIGVFYGYRYDGIFQNAEEVSKITSQPSLLGVGFRRYKDLNGDGKVDANNDREILGNPFPLCYGGFTNTFGYKGFELNVFLQYNYGGKLFNYNAIDLETPTGGQNGYAALKDRFMDGKPSTLYPRASTNRIVLISDLFLQDASYMKLKTVSLSYRFPKVKVPHIQALRVFVTAQNLITWTKYEGYDPEVSYQGASTLQAGEDFGGYPQARTWLAGVKLDIF